MRQVRHLLDLVSVAAQQLRERGLVVPARVALVDPGPTADPVHEVRDREHVRRGEHEPAAGLEMTARGVEEPARARQVLDELARPHDVERAAEIERLRVGRDHVVAPLPGARRELRVELDADGLGRDRRDRRVHPVGPVDARSRRRRRAPSGARGSGARARTVRRGFPTSSPWVGADAASSPRRA